MTTIAELRRDHDRFCAAMEQGLAELRHMVGALAAEAAGDDDPPPSRPGAALGRFEPYPGRKFRRAERPRSRAGLEYSALTPEIEYRHVGGYITRVA